MSLLKIPLFQSGITPLHKAAEKGDIQLVELLVSRGADVDSTDNVRFYVTPSCNIPISLLFCLVAMH